MIAKAVKGSGARGVLNYAIEKEKGEKIGGNMAGDTPRELSAEFSASRRLRPNLSKAVHHVSLSVADGERLTDAQWRQVADTYREKMGFDGSQFVLVRHSDQDHDHVHLIQSRIRLDGSVVSDSKDYERQEEVMRQVERDLGLQSGERQSTRKALTKSEIAKAERTGVSPVRSRLHAACSLARDKAGDLPAFRAILEDQGVKSELTATGGLVLELDGVKFSATKVDRIFSAHQLQKAWGERDGKSEVLGDGGGDRAQSVPGSGSSTADHGGAGEQNREASSGSGLAEKRARDERERQERDAERDRKLAERDRKAHDEKRLFRTQAEADAARAANADFRSGGTFIKGTDSSSGRWSSVALGDARARVLTDAERGIQIIKLGSGEVLRNTARGVEFSAGAMNERSADAALEIAKQRGWGSIEIRGTVADQLELCRAAERAGMKVDNPPEAWTRFKSDQEKERKAREAAEKERAERERKEREKAEAEAKALKKYEAENGTDTGGTDGTDAGAGDIETETEKPKGG
jgi:hypothetical protein